MKTAELYELDFAEWATRNAELLRSGRVSEADLENIAEEIEALAKRERRSLINRLARLIEHLLKWQYQPQRRGTSWQTTIYDQRLEIEKILADNPSFRPGLPDCIVRAYRGAAGRTAILIKRKRSDFPAACPYTQDQLLDQEFLPD